MVNPFYPQRYVNPVTDFGFKRLFGTESNKDLLIDFLNAIIGLDEEERIHDVTFLNPEQLGSTKEKRNAVYDIFCLTEHGDHVIVEMQNEPVRFFKDRSVFYSAFPIRDQAVKGRDWNFELKAVYAVGLLNFCFSDSKDDERYLHRIQLMDTEARTVFYDKLTFVFAELPKFKKTEAELATQLDKWLFAINHLCELDEPSPALTGEVFEKLFHEAAVASFSAVEAKAYFYSQKQYWDYVNSIEMAEMRGRHIGTHIGYEKGINAGLKIGEEKGREEGLKIGEEKGREVGIKDGIESNRIKVMEAMKALGLSNEIIANVMDASR